MTTGIHLIDALLAVGVLESDRAAAMALDRRVQEASIARTHAEAMDRQAAQGIAERRMARILGR